MDDFETGPQSFNIYLNSSDNKASKEPDGFTTQLIKPLNFSAGIWEVALKQVIFKQHFPQPGRINYTNEKGTDFFDVLPPADESLWGLINALNKSLPSALKKDLSFAFDKKKDQFYIKLVSGQVEIKSLYLAARLGLEQNTLYPATLSDKPEYVYLTKPMESYQVFKITADFLTPEMYGSKFENILVMDTTSTSSNIQYLSYEYDNPSYIQILGSYISSINIKFLDLSGDKFINIDENSPIILKLHFRKHGVF